MSCRYAHQKLKPSFDITADALQAFLAILLLSGYVPLPRCRMYWEQTPDVRNEAVTGATSLNRSEEILRYLHVIDNTQLDSIDKMVKITIWTSGTVGNFARRAFLSRHTLLETPNSITTGYLATAFTATHSCDLCSEFSLEFSSEHA